MDENFLMAGEFHAQAEEDAILADVFRNQKTGTCLEVGALDGIQDSVTLHFEQRGWSCILIEANPELADKAKVARKAHVFACAAGPACGTTDLILARGAPYLSTTRPTDAHLARISNDGATAEKIRVPMIRVDAALEQAGVSHLDFASIDVEGAELDVLRGFDLERWKPRVILIEDNDPRVRPYLRIQGYHCFLHAGWNDWYARKSDHALLTPARRSAEWRRRCRHRIYSCTIGLLPVQMQNPIVRWKRKWFGSRRVILPESP